MDQFLDAGHRGGQGPARLFDRGDGPRLPFVQRPPKFLEGGGRSPQMSRAAQGGRSGGDRLEASPAAADARRTAHVDDHVSDLE